MMDWIREEERSHIGEQGFTENIQRGEFVEETKVVVGEYENEIDAEIAKGHLESSGISASVFKDDGGGMFPSLQNSDGVQLLVSEDQSERAIKILHVRSH